MSIVTHSIQGCTATKKVEVQSLFSFCGSTNYVFHSLIFSGIFDKRILNKENINEWKTKLLSFPNNRMIS